MPPRVEYEEHDPVRGRAIIQQHDRRFLIVNPPACHCPKRSWTGWRNCHIPGSITPCTRPWGAYPPIEEVKFSVIHNRGCFGGCNFCALAFHQGRMVTSRSHESIIREVTALTKLPTSRAISTTWAGPRQTSAIPPAKSS